MKSHKKKGGDKKMSVVVRGMKMPESCGKCGFCLKVENLCVYCMATGYQIKYGETDLRDGCCPISELPPKHGRLIDADALMAKIEKERKEYMEKTPKGNGRTGEREIQGLVYLLVKRALSEENAPTVLEAEE